MSRRSWACWVAVVGVGVFGASGCGGGDGPRIRGLSGWDGDDDGASADPQANVYHGQGGGTNGGGGGDGRGGSGDGGSTSSTGSSSSSSSSGDGCVPQPEICDNGIDDNCDGRVDDGCHYPCEDVEGHNCNGDDGHGDHCAPAENTNGCSQEKFWAWCNRRNPKFGCVPDAPPLSCIWEKYLHDWVQEQCDGEVTLEDPNNDGYPTYMCTDANGKVWECTTPLVLQFDPGAPVAYRQDDGASGFDLSTAGDGSGARTDWPTAATPWLALDRDGDGQVGSGRELFGSATPVPGGYARHGFAALAEIATATGSRARRR
ncbi:MAG: hypothetical protein HY744_15895 [Deltaproteobacteria bacterium]|nr:hypothetical protein [Deltaproteobacteria bacterium]